MLPLLLFQQARQSKMFLPHPDQSAAVEGLDERRKDFLDHLPLSRYAIQMNAAQLHFRHPTGENPGIPYPSYATGRKSVSYNQ